MSQTLTPLQKLYVVLHRAAIRRRNSVEQMAQRRLAAAIVREQQMARAAVVSVAASREQGLLPGVAILAAQHSAAAMASSIGREVAAVRQEARGMAQHQAQGEIALALDVVRKDGYGTAKTTAGRSIMSGSGAAATDQIKARLIAESVAGDWLRATLADAMNWQRSGLVPQDLARWIQDNKARIEARARRIGTTEALDAFEDEVDREIHRFFTEEAREEEWIHNVYHVWSAVMDRSTCESCWRLDGTVKPITQSFGSLPPLHPHCHCFIMTFAVPNDVRRKLPGMARDYRRLKEDFAEARDEHHPVDDFIKEALRTTSPQAALSKLREREQRHMAR